MKIDSRFVISLCHASQVNHHWRTNYLVVYKKYFKPTHIQTQTYIDCIHGDLEQFTTLHSQKME